MALPKPSAKIWIDPDKKKVILSAPFNSHFNQLIRNLPRFFNKEQKVWEFDVEFVDQVVDIAMQIWSNVIRPPFLLIEIFEFLTEEDLKEMYENLVKRHRGEKDFVFLLNKFFEDYIDLTEITRKKKRLIRIDRGYEPDEPTGTIHQNNNVADVSQARVDLDAILDHVTRVARRPIRTEEDDD